MKPSVVVTVTVISGIVAFHFDGDSGRLAAGQSRTFTSPKAAPETADAQRAEAPAGNGAGGGSAAGKTARTDPLVEVNRELALLKELDLSDEQCRQIDKLKNDFEKRRMDVEVKTSEPNEALLQFHKDHPDDKAGYAKKLDEFMVLYNRLGLAAWEGFPRDLKGVLSKDQLKKLNDLLANPDNGKDAGLQYHPFIETPMLDRALKMMDELDLSAAQRKQLDQAKADYEKRLSEAKETLTARAAAFERYRREHPRDLDTYVKQSHALRWENRVLMSDAKRDYLQNMKAVLDVAQLRRFDRLMAGPTRRDAVQGIVKLFDRYSVVAIGETPSVRQLGDLYIALVRDPEFQGKVNDIVIEFAGRHSQPLLDRYVVNGEDVPYAELCRIWRDTTQVASWESPIYAEWLAAIRDVNLKLPAEKRLRVLAGDTAVDWTKVRTHEDWAALGESNVSFAKVIDEDVLGRKRKALVVLGSSHLAKNGDLDRQPNTATRVEQAHPGSICVVHVFEPPMKNYNELVQRLRWNTPSLHHPLKGTWLGVEKVRNDDRLDRLADALLYVGPPSAFRRVPVPPDSIDQAWFDELVRRATIEWGHTHFVDSLRPAPK